MLRKIKSYYFLKLLFILTNEKIKFKLLKYNKDLKKRIDINLLDYINFSGKYIIYE